VVVTHIDSEFIVRESGVVGTPSDPDIVPVSGPADIHIARDFVPAAGQVAICIAVVLFPAPGVAVMGIRWAIAQAFGRVVISIGQDFHIQSGPDCYRLLRIRLGNRLKDRRPIPEFLLRHRRR